MFKLREIVKVGFVPGRGYLCFFHPNRPHCPGRIIGCQEALKLLLIQPSPEFITMGQILTPQVYQEFCNQDWRLLPLAEIAELRFQSFHIEHVGRIKLKCSVCLDR